MPIATLRKLRQLEYEEAKERKQLPGSVAKLLKGYELRAYWFEVFECIRKARPPRKLPSLRTAWTSFADTSCLPVI